MWLFTGCCMRRKEDLKDNIPDYSFSLWSQSHVLLIISSLTISFHLFLPSHLCWIWKDSVTAQQIGSGLHGLGIGSFSLDWSTITGFLGNPLIVPMFAVINIMIGFILFMYIIVPVAYWTNSFSAKRFPLFSDGIFDFSGQGYNVSRIVSDDLTLKRYAYDNYSIYLSVTSIYSVGFHLGAETATLTHFVLFHARDTWNQFKQEFKGGEHFSDVHNRLMKKYEPVPQRWFFTIIVFVLVLALLNSMVFGRQFQLPYWGVLLGYFLPFVLILPIGVISATTGQESIDMLGLSQLVMGWLYPSNPLGNLAFQSYGTTTLATSLGFISEFKFGHYMKIPPKSLFIAQIVGAFISYSTNLGVTWWFLATIENMCDEKKLPGGSPWTCPNEQMLFTESVIWGGVGPRRMFAPHNIYSKICMFLVIGVIATVLAWIILCLFPEKKWIRQINIPLILASGTAMPPIAPVHCWSWLTVAIIYHLVIYRKYKKWWAKYNYLLSNGLDMGIAFMALLISLTLQMNDNYGFKWWGSSTDDHCSLATCPTASGILIDGCPILS